MTNASATQGRGGVVAGCALAELRATLALALPLAAAQVAQNLMGFIAAAMMGRLGDEALAAGGLGNGLYFTVMLILQGVLTAVGPLAAHALGAGEDRRVGAIVGNGLLLAALSSVLGMLLVAQLPRLLAGIGHAPPLVAATQQFLDAALWGLPAGLGYAVMRSYLAALSRTLPLMVVMLCCLALNAALSYGLIFGHFGLPPLGLAGAGFANAAVQWVQFGCLLVYAATHRQGRGHRILHATLMPDHREARALLRLGLPISGIYALEAGIFSTIGVLAGLIGTAALAAHQVAIGITSMDFMVPLAFGHAATVRVALARGAGKTEAARRAGMIAVACGVGFMAAMALVLLIVPESIIGLYLDRSDPANAESIAIAVRLLFIVALFQVFDGTQGVAAGALRGLRDTARPLAIAGFGYWGIGFGAAWLMAFPLGLGAPGLWWGLAAGLAAVAIPLLLRFRRLTAA